MTLLSATSLRWIKIVSKLAVPIAILVFWGWVAISDFFYPFGTAMATVCFVTYFELNVWIIAKFLSAGKVFSISFNELRGMNSVLDTYAPLPLTLLFLFIFSDKLPLDFRESPWSGVFMGLYASTGVSCYKLMKLMPSHFSASAGLAIKKLKNHISLISLFVFIASSKIVAIFSGLSYVMFGKVPWFMASISLILGVMMIAYRIFSWRSGRAQAMRSHLASTAINTEQIIKTLHINTYLEGVLWTVALLNILFFIYGV